MALVLMCGFSIVFRKAWSIFRRPSLWMALAGILVLAGIWTWHFREAGLKAGGWEDNSGGLSWEFTKRAIPFYSLELAASVGYATAAFGVLGMAAMFRKNGRWAALTGLVLGVWIFQMLVPVGREARHILAATPALVLLGIAGVCVVARQARLRVADSLVQQRREAYWVLLLALFVFVEARWRDFRQPERGYVKQIGPVSVNFAVRKIYMGFEALALQVIEKAEPGTHILVCSDASGEGMFISELAMRDRRPNFVVERGSKVLVDPNSQSWSGRNMRLRFGEDTELFDFIMRSKIEYIVLDAAVPPDKQTTYHDQLRRVMEDDRHAGIFWRAAESPITRDGEDLAPPLRLYRVMRTQGLQELAPAKE
jgi:hypothetical protein